MKAVDQLQQHYIYPRRYFYPSLNQLEYVHHDPCPISEDISRRILCLPLFHDLSVSAMDLICRVLHRAQNY